MPQQLIYTSAPRGVVAGRSGHCTVARSAAMREALMLHLEKLSYYQHLSLSGGQERPIYSCRVVDIRGSRYHVLSRIQDAGLDFTGRTNFLAHHLVFTPEEIRQFPSPPVILRGWSGWVKSWSKEPQLLEKEDWSGLAERSASASVPATNWQKVTGDAVNGYGLLESRVGIAFRVDNLADEQILALFAESLELLELRDPRRDFRATAWQHTFTTSMQEQDTPADFRWRCLHSDNPASNRFAGPDCRPLSDVRAPRVTSEETMFARSGRQPPRFVIQPQNVRSTEGEAARLQAKAEGVPSPSYQWFAMDRAGNGQVVASGTGEELVVQDPPLGLSRYVVRASNSQGDVTSEVATLSVEQKLRLSQTRPVSEVRGPAKPAPPSYVKSADDIERQRRRIEAEQAQVMFQKGLRWKKVLAICGVILGLAVLGGMFFWKFASKKRPEVQAADTKGTTAAAGGSFPERSATTPPAVEGTGAPTPGDSTETPAPAKKQPLSGGLVQLPTPWTNTVVGNVNAKTSAGSEQNTFILTGAGKNIFEKSDNFFFAFRPASNVTDFSAQILRVKGGTPATRCGIMLRQSDKPDAAFVFIGVSSTNVFCVYRPRPGDACKQEHQPTTTQTVFLKLSHIEASFVGYYSIDGQNWTAVATNSISALAKVPHLLGFAICSGGPDSAVTTDFGNIHLVEPKL